MARYSETLRDDLTSAAIEGALVSVAVSETGDAATLTDDNGDELKNPFTTDEFGAVVFNLADDGLVDIEYRYGGRLRRKDHGVPVGSVESAADSAAAAEVAAEAAGAAAAEALAAVAAIGALLAANPTGLLYRSTGTLTGWTGGTSRWSSLARPALPAFDRSPILAQALGVPDAGGVREGFLFKDDDGTWWMFYDAGDGTGGAGGPWRPQAAYSDDKGLTWTKDGPMSMGLSHGYDGGSYPSTAFLFMEKRAGTYYMHRLTAGTVVGNVSGLPYASDIWSCATIDGTYTYEGASVALGSGGSFDETTALLGSIIYDGIGTYHVFYSARSSAGVYQVGHSTGTDPAGPFTKDGAGGILPLAFKGSPENPEVFWHAGLSKWVMLTNQIIAGVTVKNRAFFSGSLTDWSDAIFNDYTPIAPAFGATAIGMSRAFRSSANVAETDIRSNSIGSVPIVYDTDPTDSNHIGRKLRYTTLEAATHGLASTTTLFEDKFATEAIGVLGGQNGWIDHSGTADSPEITAGSILDMQNAVGTGTGSSMVRRAYAGTTAIAQRAVFTFGAGAGIGFVFAWVTGAGQGTYFHADFGTTNVSVGGWNNASDTSLATGTGTTAGTHLCEAVYADRVMKLYVDSVLALTYTPSSILADQLDVGGQVGLRNGFGTAAARTVSEYSVSIPLVASQGPIFKALDHASFVGELGVKCVRTDAYLDLFYFLQDDASTDNGYRLRLTFSNLVPVCDSLFKRVGGVETELSADTATRTYTAPFDFYAAIRISVQANVHTISVNGQTQLQVIDSTWTSGEAIAFSGSGEMDIRALSLRKSNAVIVNGVEAGEVVTLRGAGGIPLASSTAASSSVTFSIDHFPATSIEVDEVQRYSPAGGIWGGDSFG